MTIVYPRALPALNKFKTSSWRSNDATTRIPSPFTGQSQVLVWPRQWWSCTMTLVSMLRAEEQAWSSWLRSGRGKSGTFLLGNPQRRTPLGSARLVPGTPLVKGGGQEGGYLAIDGLPLNAPDYLLAGDHIQLGSGAAARLHEVLENVATNGAGEATLTLWPELRESPADNAPVIVSGAKGVFARTSDVVDVPSDTAGISNFSFDVEEVLA